MKYDFDQTVDRRNTRCFKWDLNKVNFKREDIISMWVADMDLPAAPEITEVIINRAKHPVYGYSFRDNRFYNAYINWQKHRNNWQIKRDWIVNSNSVVTSLCLILQALTAPEDKVLINSPVYGQFALAVSGSGRTLVTSPLRNNEGYYTPDFQDMENKFRSGIAAFILCSPHNPVGRVWKEEELRLMAELCLKYNVLLISDEIHSDLIFSESHHIPIASLSEDISRITVTCTSPGKTFNVSGMCIGFVIIENKILREKVKDIFTSSHLLAASIFAIEACQAAYEKGERWLSEMLGYLQTNRDYLVKFIRTEIPSLKVYTPEGTYLAWIDFRLLHLSQSDLLCFLVFAAGLGLDNGTKFGEEGRGFMRLNFACSFSLLQHALHNLAAAVKELQSNDLDIKKLIKESEVIEDCD
ncbi:MAG: PatB family C-S lyase [Candidatus Cloacimonetes bacterium]|nr:PatB family C-S lyase [Candidatus Cloacimonadota bacterium]